MELSTETTNRLINDLTKFVQPESNSLHETRDFHFKTRPSPAQQCTDDYLNDISAGIRLVEIYELLELCLLELPLFDVLMAQRVSKQFQAVINTSRRLQEMLFFTPRLSAGLDFKAKLNPIIMRDDLRMAIPVFFDHKEERLACSFQDGFTRLYCSSIMATTVWVYLTLSTKESSVQSSAHDGGSKDRQLASKDGSWRRMYLSQPSCFVSWRVTVETPVESAHSNRSQHVALATYSGIVKGERTMDALLHGLADSLVVKSS